MHLQREVKKTGEEAKAYYPSKHSRLQEIVKYGDRSVYLFSNPLIYIKTGPFKKRPLVQLHSYYQYFIKFHGAKCVTLKAITVMLLLRNLFLNTAFAV